MLKSVEGGRVLKSVEQERVLNENVEVREGLQTL